MSLKCIRHVVQQIGLCKTNRQLLNKASLISAVRSCKQSLITVLRALFGIKPATANYLLKGSYYGIFVHVNNMNFRV